MKDTTMKPTDPNITDANGYANLWGFSKRKVSYLLADGLPHLKIGSRRVRIFISEANAWMREKYGIQRQKKPKTSNEKTNEQ